MIEKLYRFVEAGVDVTSMEGVRLLLTAVRGSIPPTLEQAAMEVGRGLQLLGRDGVLHELRRYRRMEKGTFYRRKREVKPRPPKQLPMVPAGMRVAVERFFAERCSFDPLLRCTTVKLRAQMQDLVQRKDVWMVHALLAEHGVKLRGGMWIGVDVSVRGHGGRPKR